MSRLPVFGDMAIRQHVTTCAPAALGLSVAFCLSLHLFAHISLMSALNSRSSSVPVRTFGRLDSSFTEGGNDGPPRETSVARRFLDRISFGNFRGGRPSFSSFRRDGEAVSPTSKSDRPAIPTMMQPSSEVYSTPLPKISMVVLSIVSKLYLRYSTPPPKLTIL